MSFRTINAVQHRNRNIELYSPPAVSGGFPLFVNDNTTGMLYRSVDNGATFQSVGITASRFDGHYLGGSSFCFVGHNFSTSFTLFRSDDNGQTWATGSTITGQNYNCSISDGTNVVIILTNNDFSASQLPIYLSTDGLTATLKSSNSSNNAIYGNLPFYLNGNFYVMSFAGGQIRFLYSPDGDTWNNNGAVIPNRNGFLALMGYVLNNTGYLYIPNEVPANSARWVINSPTSLTQVQLNGPEWSEMYNSNSIEINGFDLLIFGNGVLGTNAQIHKTNDNGATWTVSLAEQSLNDEITFTRAGSFVFAQVPSTFTINDLDIWRTSDAVNWVNLGLTSFGPSRIIQISGV